MSDAGPWWNTGRIAENGYPTYYQHTELNVLLILEVWFNGEPVVFRDTQPTFLWIERFANPDDRERFLSYWIRQRVGMLADDPERLTKLRQKLLVVEPKDQHDYWRCKASSENAALIVRCSRETIVRTPPLPFFDSSESLLPPQPAPLGACPCRCHDMQRRAMGGLPRMLPADQYFRESTLDEEEALYGA